MPPRSPAIHSLSGRYPLPVTRSKGGWRRKPRRVTPFVIENYWPGERLAILRSDWPRFVDSKTIVARLNEIPAPKPVTVWQCWIMAAHLKIRRPPRWIKYQHALRDLGVENAAVIRARMAKELGRPPSYRSAPVQPETKNKLRKTGARKSKPKPKQRQLSHISMKGGMLPEITRRRKVVKYYLTRSAKRAKLREKIQAQKAAKAAKLEKQRRIAKENSDIPKWFREMPPLPISTEAD